jgi:curli biogenesis system outer membrane secretion channel CsgG
MFPEAIPVFLYHEQCVIASVMENILLLHKQYQSTSYQGGYMKRMLIATVLCFAVFMNSDVFADAKKPRIGVLRFTNQTSAGWWSGNVGRELQDMLIAELASTKAFRVLERKELDAVLQEQDLGASGRISKNTRAKLGNVTGAQYLVAATGSAFEKHTSGGGGGISFKGFSIGGKKDRSYMSIDLKLIDVETGEIADVRTVEATSKSGGLRLGIHKGGFGGNLSQHKDTPTGKAIRACIMEISEYLECSLVKGEKSGCMEEYDAKESRRREKTKGAIDLE